MVECNHSGAGHVADIKEPHKTITAKHTGGLCEPLLVPITVSNTGSSTGADASRPVHTVRTGGGGQILVTPSLMCIGQTGGGNRIRSLSEPAPTTVSKQEACIVAPSLIRYHTEQTENVRASGLGAPINTIDASNRYGLTCANLVEYYTGGRPLNAQEPMHTITSHDREAVVAAHVVKYKGTNLGSGPAEPVQTETSCGTFALCKVWLYKAQQPGGPDRWPRVRDLLNTYCGYDLGERDILLLEINGAFYYIADIGLRMLTPRELYNAMGFPADYIIDHDYTGRPYPKEKGIKTAWVDGPTPGCVAYVEDTGAGWPMWDMTREEDVDCIQHTGSSCCAVGVVRYIYSLPRDRWVCIIGRGHAVQRMDGVLRLYDYEFDQCSSTALDMAYRVARADIIVNSADAVTEAVLGAVPASAIVIDISGSMEPLRDRVADYVPRAYVGSWNIAELLRRVRVLIEEKKVAMKDD